MKYALQKKLIIFGFLVVPVGLMLLFLAYPTIRMIFYSFTDWDGVLPSYNYVGLQNFKRVLTEPTLWISLKNNLVYAVTGILANMIALLFAVLLNSNMKGAKFYKTVIFIPYVLNVTAIAFMFKFIYDFREGPINMFLRYIGANPIAFFSDTNIAIFSLVSMSFWRWLGYMTIIYIAAMQSIEKNLYEASTIDGANAWQTFRYIVLPSIIRIVELQMFLSLSGALQAFTESLVLTHGGPGKATYTFMYYVINAYTVFNDYGFAAAMSVLLIIIIFILTKVQNLIIGREEA